MSDDQFVPEWAKGIIWYQIFPERFRNGDPDNERVDGLARNAAIAIKEQGPR